MPEVVILLTGQLLHGFRQEQKVPPCRFFYMGIVQFNNQTHNTNTPTMVIRSRI
jgi:hypothetical protein